MPDTIDINISPIIETVALTIQPNLTTINVNTITGGGGAVSSVNTQTGDVVLTQDNVLDGTTYKQYSLTEKNKLAGIATGAEVNVNADWNAVSGDAQILNKPSIPAAQVNSDWNAVSGVAQILNKPTIPNVSTLVPYTGATTNVNLGEFELKAGQLTLDTTPTGTAAVTTTRWNDTLGSTETTLKGGSVILKNGVDLVARIVNKVTPNTTLTKAAYQVVKVSGAQGQRLAVDLAQGNTDLNSADTLGVVTETIAINQEGFIITVGQIEDINTTGSLQGETWADGDVLYLSPTTAGRMTNIKPNGSNGHIVVIGYVEYAHVNNGKIYIKIMNGWELDELHNVFIDTPLNNQGLVYETSTDLWKNKTIDKTFVGLGNVDNTSDANKPVSTAQSTAINAKVADSITDGVTTIAPSQNAVFDALANKVDKNSAITGATKTKITYDSKGLVTAGADLIASDIPTIAQSQVTNLVTDLAGKQATLSYTPYRFIQTGITAHTGTVAETIIATATIAGGTFNSSDVMKVIYGANKATAISSTMRIKINTSNTLTGAVTLAGMLSTSANASILKRNFMLNGGNLYGMQFSVTNTITDEATVLTSTYNSTAYNTANTLYLFFTIQITNTADSVTPNLFNITN
jgi:nitrogen fixation protein